MSETIVLYSYRYGAARQYAHMMAEELGRGARDVKDVKSAASRDIMNADRILVMNKGKVVGFGSHEQLLENCEIYREIYSSQMGGVPVNG